MSETISHGSSRAPARWRRLALALVVALGLGLVLVDDHQRGRETDALLDRVEAGQAAVTYADRRVAAMRQYLGPLLTSGGTTEPVRASMRELLFDAGEQVAERVRAERAAVAEIAILPWHHEQLEAQADYLAYLDARAAFLDVSGRRDAVRIERRTVAVRAHKEAVAALTAATGGRSAERVEALTRDPLT